MSARYAKPAKGGTWHSEYGSKCLDFRLFKWIKQQKPVKVKLMPYNYWGIKKINKFSLKIHKTQVWGCLIVSVLMSFTTTTREATFMKIIN